MWEIKSRVVVSGFQTSAICSPYQGNSKNTHYNPTRQNTKFNAKHKVWKDEKGIRLNSTVSIIQRQRKTQTERLAKDFEESVNSFKTSQKEISSIEKEVISKARAQSALNDPPNPFVDSTTGWVHCFSIQLKTVRVLQSLIFDRIHSSHYLARIMIMSRRSLAMSCVCRILLYLNFLPFVSDFVKK